MSVWFHVVYAEVCNSFRSIHKDMSSTSQRHPGLDHGVGNEPLAPFPNYLPFLRVACSSSSPPS
jgi:hypothetical protein